MPPKITQRGLAKKVGETCRVKDVLGCLRTDGERFYLEVRDNQPYYICDGDKINIAYPNRPKGLDSIISWTVRFG